MPTATRRRPQQQRSRELVARVLDAAERLLADDPRAPLSTTRIAAEAGVSVGALYQYFPDTGAVVAALARRHMDAFEALMERAVASAAQEGWDDPVDVLVDAVAARYREQPGYRALWFGPHMTVALREADRRNKVLLADGLRRVVLALELARDDAHLVTVCQAAVHTCDSLLQEAFRRDPTGEAALVGEAKAILRAYLDRVVAHYAQGERR